MRSSMIVTMVAAVAMAGCVNTAKRLSSGGGDSGGSGSAAQSGSGSAASLSGGSCGASAYSEFDTAVNAYRQANGLPTLNSNSALASAAAVHSADIAPRSSTSHVGSDGSRFNERVQRAGYGAGAMHENIAQVRGGASAAIDQRDASPAHRRGLRGNYQNYGIACETGADGYQYWTLVLATSV